MKLISDTGFHQTPEKQYLKYLRALDNAIKNGILSEAEIKMIKSFISENSAQSRITNNRKYNLAHAVIIFRQYLPHYKDCTTQDVYLAVEEYRSSTNHSEIYQSNNLAACKKFLIWLAESGNNSHIDPTRIVKIKVKAPKPMKTEEDILTGEELKRFFSAMKNLRNRVLFEVLYDSMGRIGEIAMLTWNQIVFYDRYATVTIDSKTGNPRKVPLHTAHVLLRKWKDQYPTIAGPDKYVFPRYVSSPYTHLSYSGVLDIFKEAMKVAGITKPLTPHAFRHTRITDLMRMGIPEQTIKMMAWGTVTTEMLRVYAHLTPTDAEIEMNRWMGIKMENRINPFLNIDLPTQCNCCGVINPKTNMFCGDCGNALSEEAKARSRFGRKY
jgi:integrase